MSQVFVLFANGCPVAGYECEESAFRAISGLPGSLDPYLCLVAVPVGVQLEPDGDCVGVAVAGERRASGAAGRAAVTLSPNGNKIT